MTNLLEVDLSTIESTALRRIVGEVQNDISSGGTHCYDRVHCRHNRSMAPDVSSQPESTEFMRQVRG